MLVFKYSDLVFVDSIELSESEKEEVEETEMDDFLADLEIDMQNFNANFFVYNSSNLIIINHHSDVFTPPPEISIS